MNSLCPFTIYAPKSLREALALLKRPRTSVLAGGTILLNTLKKTKKGPEAVVSLGRIKGLSDAKETKTTLVLGAGMTISDVMRLPAVAGGFPSLAAACRQLATTPLRNMATIGGNCACRFFWADLPAVLMSLEARLVLETPTGRKEMSVDTFVSRKTAGPFILSSIELLKRSGPAMYLRHTRTMPVDIPVMAVAFAAEERGEELAGVRLVLNSAVAPPARLKATEKICEGRKLCCIDAEELVSALTKDTAGLRLDDTKRAWLKGDIEMILAGQKI